MCRNPLKKWKVTGRERRNLSVKMVAPPRCIDWSSARTEAKLPGMTRTPRAARERIPDWTTPVPRWVIDIMLVSWGL